MEKHEFKGKGLVVRINRTLMGAPPVVIGLLTYILLRKKGPLGDLRWVFTIKGMVVAQTLIITPIICGMVYSYLVRTAPKIRAFAKTMGADKWQTDRLILSEIKNEIYFSIVTGFGRSISLGRFFQHIIGTGFIHEDVTTPEVTIRINEEWLVFMRHHHLQEAAAGGRINGFFSGDLTFDMFHTYIRD